MTREEHLSFCKKCTNKENNFTTGLVCKLTGEKANFEVECNHFTLDENYVEPIDNTEAIEHNEVLNKLSEKHIDQFKSEQRFSNGLIAGLVAGVLGAVVWGVITVATGYQIGYMAIAIGAGVGVAIRYFGKGIDQIFGISGAIVAILSCLLGNFFSIIGFVSNNEGLGVLDTLSMFDYGQIIPIMSSTFSPMDLFFYGIAGYEGYKFAFRTFTEEDLQELK